MQCGEATFSCAEVREILIERGFEPGTHLFTLALKERFVPAFGLDGYYVDNPAFDPDDPRHVPPVQFCDHPRRGRGRLDLCTGDRILGDDWIPVARRSN